MFSQRLCSKGFRGTIGFMYLLGILVPFLKIGYIKELVLRSRGRGDDYVQKDPGLIPM